MSMLNISGLWALFACASLFSTTEGNNGQYLLDGSPFSRQIRQFYRFGRASLPEWDDDDSSASQAWLVYNSEDSLPQALADDDGFIKDRRKFYRFSRAYHPYQDKRFLRFGRSFQSDSDDLLQSDAPLFRKRRFAENGSQSEKVLQKAVQSSGQSEKGDSNRAEGGVQKVDEKDGYDLLQEENPVGLEDLAKRFMRFGRSIYSSEDSAEKLAELENMLDNNYDKRFMRFGKRFMRFGRSNEDDEGYEKRFMRFGKSLGEENDANKRFMRFGKSGSDESDANKRFFRFGKRFMRFGKRFMRFGLGDKDFSDNILKSENNPERFTRNAS